MTGWRSTFIVLLVIGIVSVSAMATSSTFFFEEDGRYARAVFDTSGSGLVVTLTNTSPADVMERNYVLTALMFDVAGNPALTPVAAMMAPGSHVLYGDTPADMNVSGEWAFRSDLAGKGLPCNAAYGISSAGLDDTFGPKDLFDDTRNLEGPLSPNGLNYGITSAGDHECTFQGNINNVPPLIQNEVIFTFLTIDNFDAQDISNVCFQYGTSLSEPFYPTGPPPMPVIPEPMTMLTALLGITALGGYIKRKRNAQA